MSDLHRPAHVPSYLIWGGWYGSRNIGDSAILLGLKDLIERVNPDGNFYIRVLSTDPDYTSTKGVTGEKALLKSEWWRPWAWLRILRIFARPDRVIVSGGTPIFDSSHVIRTLYLALPILFRTPFVVFGAGVKPVRSWYGRHAIPFFLQSARFVSVRDEASQSTLEQLGVSGIELTADSAFFAKPASPDVIDSLLTAEKITVGESILVVAPRALSVDRRRFYLEEQMGPDLIRETPGKLATTIDSIASRFVHVVLVAMHYHGPDSDVPMIRDVLKHVHSPNVCFIDRELRPEVALGLFRRARLLLGVRLHALLLASSMGTPIVGIAYEEKVRELFLRLGLQGYCTDLFKLDSPTLVSLLDTALNHEQSLRVHLSERVDQLRACVIEGADRALRFVPTVTDAVDSDGE